MRILICFLYLFLIYTNLLNAQWETDVRLTNDNADSYTSPNYTSCIAANGDSVYVVWYDFRDGNNEIYFKRSTNGGINWSSDIRLTNNSGNSRYPSISISGAVIYILWQDSRDGNNEIYFKISNDAGVTWSNDIRLTNNLYNSVNPAQTVSGQNIHIIWSDSRANHMNETVFYKHSTNGGINWSTDTNLTDYNYVYSSIAASNNFIHIAWNKIIGSGQILYKQSTSYGVNWSESFQLTNYGASSESTCISASDNSIHIVWHGYFEGNPKIYYVRSTDAGLNWGTIFRLTNNTNTYSFSPNIFSSGLNNHVVWYDNRDGDGNWEIYYKLSSDGGISWGNDTRLTNSTGISNTPSVTVSGQVVHIVWSDNRDGNYEIYYKRNPNGNITEIKNLGNEIPKKFTLYQNYPNPFNPSTNITYEIPNNSFVMLKIYDLLGREVQTLVNEKQSPETYEVEWNASQYPSSIYFYKLETENFTETKRMILIK